MPKLVVIAKGKPREIEMGQELTIGRGYSNLLRLEGDEISRVHAIIYRRNGDFILRDLDSKNGVFLNGNKINHAQLDSGDRVQVGKYKMIFNPPANFDLQGFVSSAVKLDANSNAAAETGPAALEDYSSSRRFKVAVGSTGSSDVLFNADPGIEREEITILSRFDFGQKIAQESGRIAEMAADYQDLFFYALLRETTGSSSFPDAILTALLHALSADRGVIVNRDKDTGSLSPLAIIASNPDVAINRVVLKAGFSEGKALLCPATADCGMLRDNETIKRDRINTLISLPIGDMESQALLYLDRLGESEPFNLGHLITAGRVAKLIELHLTGRETSYSSDDIT